MRPIRRMTAWPMLLSFRGQQFLRCPTAMIDAPNNFFQFRASQLAQHDTRGIDDFNSL
jgi:hypothetical protein